MNLTHLRAKGWTQGEIDHARKILNHAESVKRTKRNEHAALWFTTALITVSCLGVLLLLFPVLHNGVGIGLLYLMGACFGALFVTSVRILEHKHELAGVLVLLAFSAILAVSLLSASGLNPWLAVPLVLGMLTPYLVHWRTHGPA